MQSANLVVFCENFRGRLETVCIEGVLSYIAHGEEPLAFELLCDYIAEFDVKISPEEYREATELAASLGMTPERSAFRHLKELVFWPFRLSCR